MVVESYVLKSEKIGVTQALIYQCSVKKSKMAEMCK